MTFDDYKYGTARQDQLDSKDTPRILVDWQLLRNQKTALVSIVSGAFAPIYNEELDGLIHFIDAFQDFSVAQCHATKEEVFGE